jgi:predicted nucleic acid-binding protein
VDAFDADVLIYAAVPGHPLGRKVAGLLAQEPGRPGIGSCLLLTEVLSKPLRDGRADEVRVLAGLLARLDLRPLDRATAELATVVAAKYGLRAADAVHLATAIGMGADRFVTNNKRDFGDGIKEIDIAYPDCLPDAAVSRPPGG